MAVESESKLLVLLDQLVGSWRYEITKIDLNPYLSSSKEEEEKKKNRHPPPSGFALSRCSRLGDKSNRPPPPSLSRCKHLTLSRFGRHLRVLRQRRPRRHLHRPPLMPKPLSAHRQGNFPCALGVGVAVLGSKIYILGGEFPGGDSPMHRGVYMIDASSDSPEMVKLPCELNFGKITPVVCTIGAKIYALPATFSHAKFHLNIGNEFECFDPQSNSWTVLPDPRKAIAASSRKFEHLKIENPNYWGIDLYVMNSHAVVGSCLLISVASGGGVYTFDTAQPDKGWRRILIVLENDSISHLLNFLPFDHVCSFPIWDDLIFCSPRVSGYDLELNAHIFRSFKFNIRCQDSYVCSFNNPAALRDPKCVFIKVSIHPVTGLDPNQKLKPFKQMEFVNCRTIGDGLVLVSKVGNFKYGFDIYQVGRDKDHPDSYRASKISSATFRRRLLDVFDDMTPWVIKG